ncbi:hydantoinase/oxoprolinase family protein [Methanobrevibacter filiformis]|uniref:Hydantoinase/oxoprolinase n=1 Tax=Methanobrevibacter filiformis TaxID=55758 RepID=A0A166A860_9EURY|nr:hydantoinase/oxoprolinase family protein [Methanobrevibacter filiformis]KZX11701.1 hydantoinase/oxoprolinase [Methanobrevibacter filiformis]
MKIAGFDIGGANTDLAIVDFNNSTFKSNENISTNFEYLPMWSNYEDLGDTLLNLIENTGDLGSIDAIGISMTAELVDAYATKKEGVLDIVKRSMDSLDKPIYFIGLNGVLTYDELVKNPLKIAAANWVATSHFISNIDGNCVFVDTGSTTTDIIPIKNGKECAKGRSDFERLSTGELVYTGTLRTNLATFIDSIHLNGNNYTVASELFATTADIYNVLDKIDIEDYSCATSDGNGKSIEESMIRISRILCADLDILSKEDIIRIANYCYKKQVEQIAIGLNKVIQRENIETVITTGLGGDILAFEAAKSLNFKVKKITDIISHEQSVVAPAIGTAIMVEKYLNDL